VSAARRYAEDESMPLPQPAWRRLGFSFRRRLPVILQHEVTECAPACLAMIAGWHGYRTTLSELRRRFCISLNGTTVASIAEMAAGLGLAARSVRAELRELACLRLPAILHWRLDHFVVLAKVSRRGLVVHDPARGKRLIPWSEVSRCFTGVAVELQPTRGFKRASVGQKLRVRDLWQRSRGMGSTLAQIVLLSAILQLLALTAPLINQLVVDEAIAKNDRDFLQAILVGFGLLLVCQAGIDLLRSTATLFFEQTLTFQLRSNLVRHLFSLPGDYFEKRHIGDVVSRIDSIGVVQAFISSAVVVVLIDGLLAVTTLVVMLMYSPLLTAAVIVATALALLARLAGFPYLRRLIEEKVVADAGLQTMLMESIRAIRPIKLFARESERHRSWQNNYVDAANIGIQQQKFGIAAAAGSRLLFGGLDLAVFCIGALQVIGGSLTLGMFFAFQAYRMQFSGRASALIQQYFEFRTLGVHLDRLADIVLAEPEVSEFAGGRLLPEAVGDIELLHARFRYGEDQPWILDNASLRIKAGERVALVGSSGCGKTTLLKILLGLHPLQDGEVRFGGVSVDAAGLRVVRSRFGAVMQDDRLLSGTLAENVAFFDEAIDMRQVVAAAEAACIAADIERMPMGYSTLIGDMGSALSGGQKQRILLARALYRKPQVLFLDEGTANLDGRTEGQVLASLERLGMTQVIVAHRPAAVATCTRVLEVANGEVQPVARS